MYVCGSVLLCDGKIKMAYRIGISLGFLGFLFFSDFFGFFEFVMYFLDILDCWDYFWDL